MCKDNNGKIKKANIVIDVDLQFYYICCVAWFVIKENWCVVMKFNFSKKIKRRIILFEVSILSCICVIGGFGSSTNNDLRLRKYKITDPFVNNIRIIQLTDLHNSEFGTNNSELINLVSSQSPDLIFMTGDMLNGDEENTEIAADLIGDLTEIAPVYFSYGNHELEWEETFQRNLKDIFEEVGAIVLDNEYQDIEINENQIRVGGYYGYYKQPGMLDQSDEEKQAELDFTEDFENTDRYKILLCHIPTAWLDWEYIDKYPVDLVLSGHYHGGQIKLPLIGGLYAPYVGLFPEYTEGMFEGKQATCILSTGLGSSTWIPRLYNPPEIVVVDLIPE